MGKLREGSGNSTSKASRPLCNFARTLKTDRKREERKSKDLHIGDFYKLLILCTKNLWHFSSNSEIFIFIAN